ncbi:MAG: aldose 1-epimerase [Porphyrobacter sp.]|nr:aldose 1-epimerase [Porphyrobacter sp.]
MISLTAGAWEAEVRPEAGGSIAALRYREIDVLRPMPAGSLDPLQAACFPLVPYCNRIASGRFEWAEEEIQLPPNFLPERHSLHGLSWQRPWKVESQVDTKCVLVDDYDGSEAWPWAYHAQQRIRLGPKGCAITLVLINRSAEPMPAGLGLHPYFRRRPEAAVRFEADHVLLVSAETLPTGVTAPAGHFGEFASGHTLPPETVDHCFVQWHGTAEISDDLGTIRLSADGTPHLHLYAPADGSALCLEPVSHTPDALNRAPGEMTVLPPGCAAAMTLWISAS